MSEASDARQTTRSPGLHAVVTTGARLHFGLLARNASRTRTHGGLGLMVDAPQTKLVVSKSDLDRVTAPEELTQRLAEWLRCGRSADWLPPFPLHVEVTSAASTHSGFGSGTQLATAFVAASLALSGKESSPQVVAKLLGRGKRSAVGLHGFFRGGLLVDGGHPTDARSDTQAVAPLVSRVDVPSSWRFVLITPRETSDKHGSTEVDAFASLGDVPAETTDRLCGLLLLRLLPAVVEADFPAFAHALDTYGRTIGNGFAPIQNGEFASPAMARIAASLRQSGVPCVVQSSWGPTICVPAEDRSSAEGIARDVAVMCDSEVIVRIAAPRNVPADVRVTTESPASLFPLAEPTHGTA